MKTNEIINKLNEYLLETEEFSNSFLPLQSILEPIKTDFNDALNCLKDNIKNCNDISDKIFYINRYADLIRKIEGIFDSHNKRLQQSLYTLSKVITQEPALPEETELNEEDINESSNISPEKFEQIIALLKQNN